MHQLNSIIIEGSVILSPEVLSFDSTTLVIIGLDSGKVELPISGMKYAIPVKIRQQDLANKVQHLAKKGDKIRVVGHLELVVLCPHSESDPVIERKLAIIAEHIEIAPTKQGNTND